MSVRYRSRGSEYYGLVSQIGPGRPNEADAENLKRGPGSAFGNGTTSMGMGGTEHSGHGSYRAFIRPRETINPRLPSSMPSRFVTRSVMYKPLVFDATTKVPGRAEALERYKQRMKVGRAMPRVEESYGEAEEDVAYDEELQDVKDELTRTAEVLASNPVVPRPSGMIGSAPADTTGAIIHEGKSVGDVLTEAAGYAATGAAAVRGIPVVGEIGAVAAGGLAGAAAAARGVEALADGEYSQAYREGKTAYREAQNLREMGDAALLNYGNSPLTGADDRSTAGGSTNGSYYTADDGNSNFSSTFSGYQPGVTGYVESVGSLNSTESSSPFSSTFSGYRPGVTGYVGSIGSLNSSGTTNSKIDSWLESAGFDSASVGTTDYGSLEEFRAELEELIANESDKTTRQKLLQVKQMADQDTQTSGSRVVEGGMQTEARPRMVDAGTQARNIPAVVAALDQEIERLVTQVGAGEEERQRLAFNTVRWLNLLGLDTQAIEQALSRPNPDLAHVEDLIQEARDEIRLPLQRAVDVSDMIPAPRRNMGYARGVDVEILPYRPPGVVDGVLVPPRENLIDQAIDLEQIGRRTRRGSLLEGPRPRRRRLNPIDRQTQAGGSFVNARGNMPSGGRPVTRRANGISTQTPGNPMNPPNTRSRNR